MREFKIRGKSLKEWKDYCKHDDIPIKTLKYIYVLEERVNQLTNKTINERYSKSDIRKYGDDWKITTWDESQNRRIIVVDGYKTKHEAEHDREIFNARHKPKS